MEQHQRIDSLKMEALRQKHILEGRRLPKQLKQEFKNQFSELRKQLRMQKDPDEKEKLKDVITILVMIDYYCCHLISWSLKTLAG